MELKLFQSRYVLTLLAVILVITALILIALDALQLDKRFSQQTGQSSQSVARQAYIKGYLAARKNYQALCPLANLEVRQFTGAVTEISDKSLKVLQQSLDTDSLVDGVDAVRTVVITPTTVLQRVEAKPLDQIEKDLTAARTSSREAVLPPSLYIRTLIKLSDIQVGQRISVESATDVRLQSTVEAVTITKL